MKLKIEAVKYNANILVRLNLNIFQRLGLHKYKSDKLETMRIYQIITIIF